MKNNSYKEVDYVGNVFYYLDHPSLKEDLFHREDGPAVELSSGLKEWWILGKRHRLDGPAFEYGDGRKEWWLNGQKLSCTNQEEFERFVKLRALW